MWHHLKDLWQHNRAALVAFMVVISVAAFFGARTVRQFVYWSDPQHQDQALVGWMTPRYVAQSYRVPPKVIQTALGLDPNAPPRRISLETLAEQRDIPIEALQARVDRAVATWRAANPRPAQ